jgi:AhpD family alkylhydroperoxidase
MTQRLNYARHSKAIYEKLSAVSLAIKNESSIDSGLLHLVDIRASQLNGCAFCVDMHIKEAKIHGERELRLHHLVIWRESNLFNEKERAALELVEAVTKLGAEGVSDEIYQKVSTQFSEKEISDLVFAIATINAWNRLGVTFRSTPGSGDKAFGLDKAGLS